MSLLSTRFEIEYRLHHQLRSHFRRVSSAGFQLPRLSGRVNHGVLFFVIAIRKIQLCLYYTQPQPEMSRAAQTVPLKITGAIADMILTQLAL